MPPPLCEVCRRLVGQHICQDCGSAVCSRCFDPGSSLCSLCIEAQRAKRPASVAGLGFEPIRLGSTLLLVGFVAVLAGAVLLLLGSQASGASSSGGLIIFLGPFPIAVGYGPYAPLILLIGVLLALAMVALLLLYGWPRRVAQGGS